jgi:hypothetical protein
MHTVSLQLASLFKCRAVAFQSKSQISTHENRDVWSEPSTLHIKHPIITFILCTNRKTGEGGNSVQLCVWVCFAYLLVFFFQWIVNSIQRKQLFPSVCFPVSSNFCWLCSYLYKTILCLVGVCMYLNIMTLTCVRSLIQVSSLFLCQVLEALSDSKRFDLSPDLESWLASLVRHAMGVSIMCQGSYRHLITRSCQRVRTTLTVVCFSVLV